MAKLSVNINKIATLRNARGGNLPNVVQSAIDCELFGAQGITIHPRPDERHIKYQDARDLKSVITTEYNIEGNPVKNFIDLVTELRPTQVTLVPDADNVLTSNNGWDTIKHKDYLIQVCGIFKSFGIRTSIFVNPEIEIIKHASDIGCDRIELYTESYAKEYSSNREKAIEPFIKAAQEAVKCGLGINAGHDLNLENLKYFNQNITGLLEVSIGHALICDSIYLGLENTIQAYIRQLKNY